MFVIFQIVACLRTKFGNVEAVDKATYSKEKIPREMAPTSWTLVGLNSERNKNAVNTA